MSVKLDYSHLIAARNGQRKLTTVQVREARLCDDTNGELARRMGVSRYVIESARAGRTYGPLKRDERIAHDRRNGLTPPDRLALADYMLTVGNVYERDGLDHQSEQEARDAAWECSHGRLPHDHTPPCGCWPQEIIKDQPPQEATNGSHHDRLTRLREQLHATPAGAPVGVRGAHD